MGEPMEVELSREQRRSRRKRRTRKRTLNGNRIRKRDLEVGALLYPERGYWRPSTRGDCEGVERPCPYVACKYNLYLDVNDKTGSIAFNFPDIEPEQMHESCALDVAEQGGETLEFVGEMLNLTRERIRQVEVQLFAKIIATAPVFELDPDERRMPCRAHQLDPDSDSDVDADDGQDFDLEFDEERLIPTETLTRRKPANTTSGVVQSKRCAGCGRPFLRKESYSRAQWAAQRFCSRACVSASRRKAVA